MMNVKLEKSEMIDALEMVKQQIISPDTWVKGFWAVNAEGFYRAPESPEACKWCLSGAICGALRENYLTIPIRDVILKNLPKKYDSLANFNDDESVTHADVMYLIDKTIVSVKKS